jgi:hypothetical protein
MTDRTPTAPRSWSGLRGAAAIAVGFALLSFGLHTANMLHHARLDGCDSPLLLCRNAKGAWGSSTGDYHAYLAIAIDIVYAGGITDFWKVSYIRRTPGYPLLMVAAYDATGMFTPVHWAGPFTAAGAAAAVVGLAFALGGRRAAILAGILFCLWLSAYRHSVDMRTDAPHAFAAVMAVCASLAWRRSERAGFAGVAALVWMFTQAVRPSLFGIAAILPVLLFKRGAPRRYLAISGALLAATLLVPAFVVGSNAIKHGAPVATEIASLNLACYSVPRMMAELGHGRFADMRRRCVKRFRAIPIEDRTQQQTAWAIGAFRLHPGAAVRSFAGEFKAQMLAGIALSDYPKYAPSWLSAGRGFMFTFWCVVIAGIAIVARRDPPTAVFAVLFIGMIILPATTSHYVGNRLRLPVDVLCVPFAAVAIDAALKVAARWRRERGWGGAA